MTEEGVENKFNMKNVDFSVIRKALQASGKMVEQIIDGIHCGSTEIRRLILEESDIIIECKICRNLFRALPNFVAHKRIYCLDSFMSISKVPSTYCPSSEDVVIVEPEPPDDAREFVKSLSDPNLGDSENEPNPADPKSKAKGNPECAKIFPKISRRKPNLLLLQKLTEIGSGEKSSYPKSSPVSDSEDSKPDNSTSTTPRYSGNTQVESVLKSQLADYRQLKCLKCDRKLSSRNSLSHHIVNLHAERKRCYSCPYCGKIKGKFRYIGGVVRHLGTAHNLKKYQIDKLRKKVKENSWFEDNQSNEIQPNLSRLNRKESSQKKTKEDSSQLKLKIKIFPDSDASKEPSYEMVWNDKPATPDKNPDESTLEENELSDLSQLKEQSSEEAISERSGSPLALGDDETEPEQDSKSEKEVLENSNLSDEAASEISDKDSIPELECEMDVFQNSGRMISGNPSFPILPSVRLSPLRLPETASELSPPVLVPSTSHERVLLNLSTISSPQKFSDCVLEEPMKSDTSKPESISATSSSSNEDSSLEEKPELTPVKISSPPKLERYHQPEALGLDNAEPPSFNSLPFQSEESSSMVKPRSARSRMLFVCEHCKKCFGQKKTLDDHARLCSDWIHQPKPSSLVEPQKPKIVPKVELKKDRKDFRIEPKKAIRRMVVEKHPDSKPTESSKMNNFKSVDDNYDKKKVLDMIDGKALKCLDCNQKFSNQSHLRRHAVRHLGWRRFKCKLCKFTSYDKSETKTHIKRCHLGKTHGLTTKCVDYYIADLNAENSSKKIIGSSKSSDKSAATMSSNGHSPKKSDSSNGNLNGAKCESPTLLGQDCEVSTKSTKNEKRLCLRIVPTQLKNVRTSPRKPVPKIDKMSSHFIKKY